jgi:PAS domain S-box-containing protein
MAHFGGWSANLDENRVIWSEEVAKIHGMEPGYSPSIEEGISFYAPEWKEKMRRVFGECVRHGTRYDEEMEIITATGERRWVRTTGEAVKNEHGRITGVHGALQDITQRKEAEEAWKNAYAQIEDNMVKFSVLNDQIRNPLTVIMALADLDGGESAEKIIEQVKAIDRIVTLLDQGVLESESIRMFMRRHDQLSG